MKPKCQGVLRLNQKISGGVRNGVNFSWGVFDFSQRLEIPEF